MKRLRRPQSRAVTLTYGGVALVILLVIAAVALVVSPPAPPSVAEYAPQADETIDDSPDNQSSQFGDGAGDCAEGQVCEGGTTSTTEADGEDGGGGSGRDTIDVKRVRRCVGNPPRQTEDPQSPPCVNYFEGDNGGATAKGVTGDEIRVGIPENEGGDLIEGRYFEYLLHHFNSRYELYGRKLRLVKVNPAGGMAQTAVDADEKGAFAFLTDESSIDLRDLQLEAARRGILTVAPSATYADARLYRELAPHAWSYGSTFDEVLENLGRLVCTSLRGREARFAGPELRTKQRRFAVFTAEQEGRTVNLDHLMATLDRCGVPRPTVYPLGKHRTDQDVANAYLNLRREGTTSILSLADAGITAYYMGEFPVEYEPEWIMSGLASHEDEGAWRIQSKRRNLLGNFTLNKLVRAEDAPAWWAFQEGPGATEERDTREVHPARHPNFHVAYRSLLLLASGIQMAGPKLTPEAFEAGLQKARFPNPGAGAAPYYQGRVEFGPGDYGMTEGVSAVWWDDRAPSYGDRLGLQGGFCYVDKGRRFEPHTWVDVEPKLFDPDPRNCR